jgi:Rrf2 family nitric oxide-sensitive transcriptional repressor
MFSVTTEYTLRAAVFLGETTGTMQTAQRVADATHVPVQYMSKVLQTLVESGLAHSQRGPTGGFMLAHPPEQITLLDVVQAVEPVKRIHSCPLQLEEHAHELCPLHKVMDELAEFTETRLRRLTLSDVLNQPVVPLGMSITKSNGRASD